jgi:hypothetical protein
MTVPLELHRQGRWQLGDSHRWLPSISTEQMAMAILQDTMSSISNVRGSRFAATDIGACVNAEVVT